MMVNSLPNDRRCVSEVRFVTRNGWSCSSHTGEIRANRRV